MENKGKVSKTFCYAAYFNICVLWGTSNLATKIGVGNLNTTVFSSFRYLIAGLTALVIVLISKGSWPKGFKQWKSLIVISFLMNFLTNGCVVLSNKYADSGVVTVILSSVPIFTTIIDSFILKNYKIGVRGWLGLWGGFIGIIAITMFGSSVARTDFKGILFALSASLFWSIGSIYSKEKVVEGSVVSHVAVEALLASVLFFITGKLTGDYVLAGVKPVMLMPAVYLAIVDSLIGFMSYICLLKVWKPSVVCTYAYINPVVALILGAVVLHESINLGKVIGMSIIIFSVILIQKDKLRATELPVNSRC